MASADKGAPDLDIFAALDLYPDPSAIFSWQPKKFEDIQGESVYVLDTNVLLLPYTTDSRSLTKIGDTFRALAKDNRLIVPGQVAREFAKHRAAKLVELHKDLTDHGSRVTAPVSPHYPLLELTVEYRRLKELDEKLKVLVGEYHSASKRVADLIRSWEWSDPVIALYRDIFGAGFVFDPEVDRGKALKDLKYRFANKIPPGYKDSAKEDLGIGDLLIWQTILELGASRHQSVTLVTSEEKADWWHRSGNNTFLPRSELVEEFRRASGGNSFHIKKLSELLDAFRAEEAVVAEVRKREAAQSGTLQILDTLSRIEKIQVQDDVREKMDEIMRLGWFLETVRRHPDGFSIQICDYTGSRPTTRERQYSGRTVSEALERAIGELQAEDWDDRPED